MIARATSYIGHLPAHWQPGSVCYTAPVTTGCHLLPLQESHDDTDARREALARFWDEVKLAQRALRPLLSALGSNSEERLVPAAA